MSYQTDAAIWNAVAKCYRSISRHAGLDPEVAEALEGLAEAIDTGDIPGDLLLRLLAGRTTPSNVLSGLAEVLADVEEPSDVTTLREHAAALEGWQP